MRRLLGLCGDLAMMLLLFEARTDPIFGLFMLEELVFLELEAI